MRKLIDVCLAVIALVSSCQANDGRGFIVGIHRSTIHLSSFPLIRSTTSFSSGICISHDCSVIATPYDILGLAGHSKLEVVGARTDKVLSLAQERDVNEKVIGASPHTVSHNVADDISVIYTKKGISKKCGMSYSYKSHVGEKVNVAGYYNHTFVSREALIIGKNISVAIGKGVLNDNLILDIALDTSSNGSAVLDENGYLLGMVVVSGVMKFGEGSLSLSVALPVVTIARALAKLDAPLGRTIFRTIPEEQTTVEKRPLISSPEGDLPEDTSPVIPDLAATATEALDPVARLHTAADTLSAQMVNLIAKECLVRGTQKPVCHELSVIDDEQNFQEIGKHGKPGRRVTLVSEIHNDAVMDTSWYEALGEIASNPWTFKGSIEDHYLFTHDSTIEDGRCYYQEDSHNVPLFGGRHLPWRGNVACFEMVITDSNFNMVSAFTEMYPPSNTNAQLCQSAVYYGWFKLAGIKGPILLPLRERTSTKYLGHKDLVYTSVSWSNYTKFRAEHKMRYGKK